MFSCPLWTKDRNIKKTTSVHYLHCQNTLSVAGAEQSTVSILPCWWRSNSCWQWALSCTDWRRTDTPLYTAVWLPKPHITQRYELVWTVLERKCCCRNFCFHIQTLSPSKTLLNAVIYVFTIRYLIVHSLNWIHHESNPNMKYCLCWYNLYW